MYTEKNLKLNIAFIISHTTHSMQWEWFIKEISPYYNVTFIIIGSKCFLSENLKKSGIKVFVLSDRYKLELLKSFFKILITLVKNKVNIVQTEMPYGNLLGIIAARFLFIKKIISTASNVTWYMDFNSKKQLIIDKLTYLLSTHIICQTEISSKFIIQNFKISPKKISTIYHGFIIEDYNKFNEESVIKLRKKYNVSNDDLVLGMIARLEKWKGHEYAIRSIKKIKEKFPNIKLLIFGKGPEEEYLKKLIFLLGLQNSVFLCGFENDIISLYKIFNIQIHTPIDPYCETFGITIIDGMLSRIPQILTLSGIAYFTAKHLENAYIVPFKDSDSIADGVIYLLSNPEICKIITNNAYTFASENFSIKQKVIKHIKLYNT